MSGEASKRSVGEGAGQGIAAHDWLLAHRWSTIKGTLRTSGKHGTTSHGDDRLLFTTALFPRGYRCRTCFGKASDWQLCQGALRAFITKLKEHLTELNSIVN